MRDGFFVLTLQKLRNHRDNLITQSAENPGN